jgi:nucleotide-binding universal stress UspA family protein
MFTRILVPTDFSKPSDAALSHARSLAVSMGARLHVLHVVDNLFLRAVLDDPCDYETAALRQLEDRVPVEDREATAVLAVERSDEPAAEIIRYARTHGVDLIVMGTHGRGRVAHLLLGSVAERVARTAPCPVLTMHEAAPPAGIGAVRILVPTDFSPSADAALGYARRLAAKVRGSVRLLHVIDQPVSGRSFGSELAVPEPTREEQTATPRIYLAQRMLVDKRSRVKIDCEVVFGSSDTTIAAYAADNGFDLIVMGTRGRSGLAHLLMGSVAESVIRTAGCPVVTVRSTQVRQALTAETAAAPVAV